MREMVRATKNFTKKMAINSRNGIAMQDTLGEFTVHAAAKMRVDDEDSGEVKSVTVFISPDMDTLTAISAQIYDVADDLIDVIDEEGDCTVRIEKRTSKGGREFLTLTLL